MDAHKIQRNFYIARLVTEELAGTITAERHRELEEWLGQTELNREMYRDLCRELATTAVEPMPEVDTAAAWKFMEERRQSRNRRRVVLQMRRWAVAAFIIVLLGGSTFFYFYRGSFAVQPVAHVVPGSARAHLILADGEVVNLEKPGEGRALRVEAGVSIQLDSGKVTYSMDIKIDRGTVSYNTLVIPRGGEYMLQLGDGTRVWLNSATTLKYPAVFSGKQRLVELDGEAYFEVARDSKLPFIVKTSTADIQVYGTSFNVCAYREDARQHTTLLSGSVGVDWQGKKVRLQPGEQAVLDVRMNEMEVRRVNSDTYCSWHTGSFIFENRPLGEVLDRLSRWYDVAVFYENPEVKDLHFTGDLSRYDDFGKILKFLEMTGKVQFSVNGKTIMVKTR